jgi:hypothetical protein
VRYLIYCSKCGKKLSDTDTFCSGCGNSVNQLNNNSNNNSSNNSNAFNTVNIKKNITDYIKKPLTTIYELSSTLSLKISCVFYIITILILPLLVVILVNSVIGSYFSSLNSIFGVNDSSSHLPLTKIYFVVLLALVASYGFRFIIMSIPEYLCKSRENFKTIFTINIVSSVPFLLCSIIYVIAFRIPFLPLALLLASCCFSLITTFVGYTKFTNFSEIKSALVVILATIISSFISIFIIVGILIN